MLQRILFVCVSLLVAASASAQTTSIKLAWDRNTEPHVTGYSLSWGTTAGQFTSKLDVGTWTEWTLTGLDPTREYHFAVQAYTADGVFSGYSVPVQTNGVFVQTSGQLLDDRPSIFWEHQLTGHVMTWHMNGTSVVDTRPTSVARVNDTNWKIVGTGDLNGDGFTDILWRHRQEGWLAAWFLQNNQVISTSHLSINRVPDPGWRVGGVGDLTGDGYADVVWHHTNGLLAVWSMRGHEVVSSTPLTMQQPETRWRIAAIADINANGYADIIWQATDGWIAAWFVRGSTVDSTEFLSKPQVLDLGWRISAAGNVHGSGVPTLVWRHANGGIALWYLSGATVTGTTRTIPASVDDPDWKIVGSR